MMHWCTVLYFNNKMLHIMNFYTAVLFLTEVFSRRGGLCSFFENVNKEYINQYPNYVKVKEPQQPKTKKLTFKDSTAFFGCGV